MMTTVTWYICVSYFHFEEEVDRLFHAIVVGIFLQSSSRIHWAAILSARNTVMDIRFRRSKCASDHHCKSEEDFERQPVSPSSQMLSDSALSLCIHVILEFEQPIDIIRAKEALMDIFLAANPRFSCLMRKDKHGMVYWEKTEVNLDDHMLIVELPPDRTEEEYDELVKDYISSMSVARRPLHPSRPLWEFHVINYKTTNAASTLIMNVHHSLGDGISLMSLMFASVRRADNLTLFPTFPTRKPIISSPQNSYWTPLRNICSNIFHYVLVVWYTILDLIGIFVENHDSELPIRGPPGVECLPLEISSAFFQIDDIRQIQNSIGGGTTVNDVVMGVMFNGIRRYLKHCLTYSPDDKLRISALALMNTRALSGLQDLQEMIKSNAKAPWGNHFGFLRLPIPVGKVDNPLDFVRRAKHILDRKKMSLGVLLTAKALEYIAKLKGPKALSEYMYNMLADTTMTVTNVVGPVEKIAMIENPVKNFGYIVSGAPQALVVTIVSYMGSLRLNVTAAKGYVDADILSCCFVEAFQEMKAASIK